MKSVAKSQTEHTPTPWGVDEELNTKIRAEVNVHAMTNCVARVTTPEDAAFIVLAVNCHEEYEKALKEIAKNHGGEAQQIALRAIAKAEVK